MFCNIYFGNIERYLLKDVFDKESSHVIRGSSSSTDCNVVFIKSKHDLHLLVRIVDDFLLISTSKETSIRFLNKLNKGIPKLGVKINSDKSRVNYNVLLQDTSTSGAERVTRIGNDMFPWCGLLINTKTCEISLDYSRFSGLQATDTVVIHRGGNEGTNLKKKMKDFVRPRCNQKLLFSSQINGMDMIRLNFYQTFVLCAIKLVHYLNGSGVSLSGHEQFIYNSACDTIHYAFLLISSKLKHGGVQQTVSSIDTNVDSSVFQLEWKDALWLGRHAFFLVFRRLGKQKYVKLCQLFMDERASNRKDLLPVTRQALKMWSV
jgi:telomerase reverse transcriptase